MGVRGKGQGRWGKSKNAKTLGKQRAGEASEAARAAKAEIDALAKLAEAQEKKAKAAPRPSKASGPGYYRDQDLPNR